MSSELYGTCMVWVEIRNYIILIMHLQCMIQERNYLNFTCFSNLDRNKQIICCTSSDFNSEHQDLIKPFDVHSRLTKGEDYFDSSRCRYSVNSTSFFVIFLFLVIVYNSLRMTSLRSLFATEENLDSSVVCKG